MDKNFAILGGLGALLIAAKKLKARTTATVSYGEMTSVHNLIVQEALPQVEDWIIEADKHQLWEILPLYGRITEYQFFVDGDTVKTRLTWSFDPIQSLILLAKVESGGGAYLNVRAIGKDRNGETLYRATADDVGAFHLNRKIWPHLLNYNRFSISNYVTACKIAAQQNTRYTLGQLVNHIANRVYRDRNNELFDCVIFGECNDISLYTFSRELAAEIYNDRWNRNADVGSEARRNFTTRFDEMPNLAFERQITTSFILQIEGHPIQRGGR